MGNIICFIVGVMFIRGHDFFSKLVGVVLICVAINPFVLSLTGRSVGGNIHSVWNAGDRAVKVANDTLKNVRGKR